MSIKMDEILSEHIKLSAEKGLTREQIRHMLTRAGWPPTLVNNYIARTFKHLEKGVILRSHALSKSFADNLVLHNVNFDVKAGEIFGIIGMSGVGKTTLLNLLVGFLKPNQGDVILAQRDGTTQSTIANPELIKHRIGFSTQTPSFYKKLTVRENLEHFAKLYGLTGSAVIRRSNSLMDLVGLKEAKDLEAAHLSGGMQKRLDIACSLLHDPDILILDEPTADLDPILRKELWTLIKQINAKGTTIILASHFLAEIELLCDRIGVLQNKKMVELGTAQELRNIYSKNYEIYIQTESQNYTNIVNALKRKKRKYVSIKEDQGELVIETSEPEKILPNIATHYQYKRGELQSLHITRPTLGKVFETLVKK